MKQYPEKGSLLAEAFSASAGWRWLGGVFALALAYNGLAVGTEYHGLPVAPFLSSSLQLLAWSNLVWASVFIAVGAVAALVELINGDPALRCILHGGVFVLFCAATLAVLFSPYPHLVAGRYALGAMGALLAALGAARQERVENELRDQLKRVKGDQ